MNADTRHAECDALLLPALTETLRKFIQRQCASNCAGSMVSLLARRTEQNVQGIANDLGDCPIIGKDDVGHAREIFIEERSEHIGLERLDKRGKTCNVGKQRRNFAALTVEIDRVGVTGQTLGEVGREVAGKRCVGPFGGDLSSRASRKNSMCRIVLAIVVFKSEKSIGLVTKSNAPRFMAVRMLVMSP